MSNDSESEALPSLLSILSAASVVNETSINLLRKILSEEDYAGVVEQLRHDSNAANMLDFMLRLICGDHLSSSDNRRARRLMFSVLRRMPVMPRSLFVTGITLPAKRDYIGSGGFGIVLKGKLQENLVALKVLYKTQNDADFCREALMWRSLNHRFVLPLLGIYEDESASQVFLVSPYMTNGTLAQWRKNAGPSGSEIKERMLEVVLGLQYIHSEGVVHGDIRGTNVLLDADLHAQIADFGLTRISEATATQTQALSYSFAAPELFGYSEATVLDSDQATVKTQYSDIYAFGCLYYEIHYDVIPFTGRNELQIPILIIRGERPARLSEPPIGDRAWHLILWCWEMKASERPTIAYIKKYLEDSDVPYNMPDSRPLVSLLAILCENQCVDSTQSTSVVNETSINLMSRVLSKDDYSNVAAQLRDESDAKDMLDFTFHLIYKGHISSPDDQKARRLLFTILDRFPVVVPRFLYITGVRILDHIDSGGFGCMLQGELQGKLVALKVLYRTQHTSEFRRIALRWRLLDHPFVQPFLGIYEDELASEIFLVFPYIANGTLARWRKDAHPSVAEIRGRLQEVAQGLRYIHSEGIVHGDLCGDHVFLDAKLHVQISDFGLFRIPGAIATHSETLSYHFAAPELFSYPEAGTPQSNKAIIKTRASDVYAFGCLYYEIYYDAIPFEGKSEHQVAKLVCMGERPPQLNHPSIRDRAWDLILWCWEKEAANRPAMASVAKYMMVSDTPYNMSDSRSLLSLLFMLSKKQPNSPIASVVNETGVNLMCRVLRREGYASIVVHLSDEAEVHDMLDFTLHLINNGHLSSSDSQRARQLMFLILQRMPVLPKSLFVTGIQTPVNDDRISSGRVGQILEGKMKGNLVALKVLHKAQSNIDFCRMALTWRLLDHRFVLPFLGVYEDESMSRFFLVTPYMTNGTLAQWRKGTWRPTTEIKERMLEVALGLEYIHSEGVVHGDIRGANILLDANFHVQISDFGLTQISEATITLSQAPFYNSAAPELFGSSRSDVADSDSTPVIKTQRSDIYAFGCLYYEIHYDAIPFSGQSKLQILKYIAVGDRTPPMGEPPMDHETWDLISRCWEMKPVDRPTIENVAKYMLGSNRRAGTLEQEKQVRKNSIRRNTSIITTTGVPFLAVTVCLSFVLIHFLRWTVSIFIFDKGIITDCRGPLDPNNQNWHIRYFRPKWFGLFGEPAPITYQTPDIRAAHRIAVADIDKRDIEIHMWVDNEDLSYGDVDLDPSVDCGDDVRRCLQLGFSSHLIFIPPGAHTVKAEIRKRNVSEPFVWGKERKRRVKWMVQECRLLPITQEIKYS